MTLSSSLRKANRKSSQLDSITRTSLSSNNTCWDIKDKELPKPSSSEDFDKFESWPDGDCRRIYELSTATAAGDTSGRPVEQSAASRHWTGWAMRNTNNHNQLVLKKSCLGLIVCSRSKTCSGNVHIRPAICDKARTKQLGKRCPTYGCDGHLKLSPCKGNRGYPVTHFWREEVRDNAVYFQSKGVHDHPRPDPNYASNTGPMAFVFDTSCIKRASSKCSAEESSCRSENDDTEYGDFDGFQVVPNKRSKIDRSSFSENISSKLYKTELVGVFNHENKSSVSCMGGPFSNDLKMSMNRQMDFVSSQFSLLSGSAARQGTKREIGTINHHHHHQQQQQQHHSSPIPYQYLISCVETPPPQSSDAVDSHVSLPIAVARAISSEMSSPPSSPPHFTTTTTTSSSSSSSNSEDWSDDAQPFYGMLTSYVARRDHFVVNDDDNTYDWAPHHYQGQLLHPKISNTTHDDDDDNLGGVMFRLDGENDMAPATAFNEDLSDLTEIMKRHAYGTTTAAEMSGYDFHDSFQSLIKGIEFH